MPLASNQAGRPENKSWRRRYGNKSAGTSVNSKVSGSD